MKFQRDLKLYLNSMNGEFDKNVRLINNVIYQPLLSFYHACIHRGDRVFFSEFSLNHLLQYTSEHIPASAEIGGARKLEEN